MPGRYASIEIRNECRSIRLSLARIRTLARAILRKAGFNHEGLSLLLVGDRRMRTLNRRFLNHDWTTDVFSFDWEGAGGMAGELIISLETAKKAAVEAGHSFRYEFYFYLCHGILHLAGYDDDTPRKRDRMFREQERILKTIGIEK